MTTDHPSSSAANGPSAPTDNLAVSSTAPVSALPHARAGGQPGRLGAWQDLKKIGWRNLFPLGAWLADKPWNLLWVRWFAFFTLFPLILFYLQSNWTFKFDNIAFIFGIYFASLWGSVIYLMLRPAPVLHRDIFKVGLFTAVIGLPLVLFLQSLPFVTSLYDAIEMESLLPRLLGFILGVGLVEEVTKALPLLWIYVKHERQDSVNTITFLGCVSGFAFGIAEAVSYSLSYAMNLRIGVIGVGEYMTMQFTRLITLPLLHALWTGINAYFIALGCYQKEVRRGLLVAGLGLAAVLHGLYNTFAHSFIGVLVACSGLFIFIGYTRHATTIQAKIQASLEVKEGL